VQFLEPYPYCDFLHLMSRAAFVITDSGGIQEETTFLDVPCLTVRHNTERPITIEQGTSVLVGNDTDTIVREAERILDGPRQARRGLPLWDGQTAPRIGDVIASYLLPHRPRAGRAANER
jgi:UDP-N-acetylglucosamine 2-epimerase (non-hydrolysing)